MRVLPLLIWCLGVTEFSVELATLGSLVVGYADDIMIFIHNIFMGVLKELIQKLLSFFWYRDISLFVNHTPYED